MATACMRHAASRASPTAISSRLASTVALQHRAAPLAAPGPSACSAHAAVPMQLSQLSRQRPCMGLAPLPMQRRGIITASQSGDGAAPGPTPDEGPKTISLVRQFPGIGYTFVLAGFLKILTMASLTGSAPVGAARTLLGQYSQFLLVPGGLLLCWIAKQIVDRDLQESPRFLPALGAVMVFLYFAIYKMLYRYDVTFERPRPVTPLVGGTMAQVRAGAGDRDRTGRILQDSRTYQAEAGRTGQYNDLSYYEGRYPSEMDRLEDEALAAVGAMRGAEGAGGTAGRADLDARNPLRRTYRRAPGVDGVATMERSDRDSIMGPR